ncbi:cap binding protein [Cordyceps fumosorosea ARSEF 2679]|uniref:Cap binding protein n=1 Tax=Cordyceps fumosorosea (strain ARSEF 2679) TaxID=1081104 RepID=A0A167MD15_CORFA|nr:cap binding protein [Cordyceps fumosorosea ARSEF 2679]OAA54218.1 cap binding protein [Cordyceps fumosorosea ARSEF 2679]
MADYDRRQSGGYSRKRRYRDDDDQYDRRQKRRQDYAPLPVRFRKQLVAIAESPLRRWADEVLSLAQMITDNYDDENLRSLYVNLVLQMVIEQPLKTPFVAAVVLVANALKPEAMEIVLERVAKDLEGAIASGQWTEVKLYLKFMACLQSNLEGDGVFPLLEELFNRAADLQTASSDDTIGTEIVKIILLTIPYVMVAAPGEFKQKAAELMDKTDIIASEPHALHALVDPYYTTDDGADSNASASMLVLLQKQLQTEAANDWKLQCLPRPWQMSLADVETQDKLAGARKHAIPAISIPANMVAGPRALFPEVYLSVYSNQEVESVPGTQHVASSLIRDVLVDTVNGLNFNRNATARFLMDIDCYFADGTFVKRATPFDELRNLALNNRSTWKPEDVAVDTVFSQLLQLPTPDCKLVYYHSVLTEACKLAPAAIAPSLGRAIRYLYRNNPRMDLELSYRCVNWFSHHLSNFGFTWKWAEWSDDAALSDLHPAKWFLNGALDKEIRLSFAQRIQKTLPEAYQHLIGPAKEQDVPEFKYKNPDTPFSAEGQQIGALLRRKATDEEIQPTIDAIQAQAQERALDPVVASTDVFVTAMCWVGSKSLSHVLACIDRSKGRLIDAGAASPAARAQIISSVMAYWHAHPGVALSIIEKLLNYSILTPFSVADWAILADSASHKGSPGAALAQPHIYEVIFNTVSKVTGRVRQVVSAIGGDSIDEEEVAARAKEVADMTELFRTVNDALESWAGGSKDELMEHDGAGGETDETLIRRWGQRWLRVFRRRAAVEAAFVAEATKDKMVVDGENGSAA